MRTPLTPLEYELDESAPPPVTLRDWADLFLAYAAGRPSRERHPRGDGLTQFVVGSGLLEQARNEGLEGYLAARNAKLVVPSWANEPSCDDLVGVSASDRNLYLRAAPERLATSTAMVVLYLHLRGEYSREEAEILLEEAHALPLATFEVLLTLLQDAHTFESDGDLSYAQALQVAQRLS